MAEGIGCKTHPGRDHPHVRETWGKEWMREEGGGDEGGGLSLGKKALSC